MAIDDRRSVTSAAIPNDASAGSPVGTAAASTLQDKFNQGLDLHQRGSLAEAARIYGEVLKLLPDHFDAMHLLGVIAVQAHCTELGIELIAKAIKIDPNIADAHINLANALMQAGRPEAAHASYARAISLDPDNAEACNNCGNVLLVLKRHQEALASYDRAIALKPGFAAAHNNRGIVLCELSRPAEALASYDRAIALSPQSAEAYDNRGNALIELARPEDALASYDQAIALKPDFAKAFNNRGIALRDLKRPQDARASYDQAIKLAPDYAEPWNNRGAALMDLNRPADAIASYERAIALKPGFAKAFNNRGIALQDLERPQDALSSYEQAIALNPDYVEAHYNRGGVLQELNRHDEAIASYDKVLAKKPEHAEALYARAGSLYLTNRWRDAIAGYEAALSCRPDYPEAKFALCMAQLPILYATESEIAERRVAYGKRLNALSEQAAGPANNLANGVGSHQPFYLAYQGSDDRALQSVYGSMVCRLMAEQCEPRMLPSPPRPAEPVRLGIVSAFFRQHANWNIPIKGWLGQLDRQKFRVFGYHTESVTDAQTAVAAALCERFVQGPLSVERWREEIARDAPHVLIYPEIGMDPTAARLAAQRLAPVQCNSWGHPDTSGFPTLDYYLSGALMEPPDAEQRYTERLVLLPNLSVYCEPAPRPRVSLDRTKLGLRQTAFVYWCGQSLYKYLPQFDQIFARIAREVADCQFAFVQHRRSAEITALFLARLDRAFATFGLRTADHCVFLPRLDHDHFAAATGLSDVFLDSIGWSGCNSTLEALAHDLPIVTMAGALMRGRHGAAMLTMMGMADGVSDTIDDYIAAAARLARDAAWRAAMKARISANKYRLYRDGACIAALERFLDDVARAERAPR